MQRLAVAVLLTSFLLPHTAFAICNNCEPNPTSPSYQNTILQRPLSWNRRELDPGDGGGGGGTKSTPAPQIFGSSSYSYAVPILHLSGRNGLDVDLTLSYNSSVWTRDRSLNTITFNADRDWPSVGFRMGYGFIELHPDANNGDTYVVTEGSGAKHALSINLSGSIFTSNDSTYMTYNAASTSRILTLKNGTQIRYEPFWINGANSTTLFRPNQIKDTNGNFITIAYKPQTEQDIQSITDTLGRVINFAYDANSNLQTISDGFHTYTFGFSPVLFRYSFTGVTLKDTSVTSGSNITVLTSCQYPNGTGYTFGYGDWGVVNQISSVAAPVAPAQFPGVTRASQSYDFPAYTPALSDAPTYHNQIIFDGINTATWIYAVTKSGNFVQTVTVTDPTPPSGSDRKKVVTTLATSGATQGLVTQTQVYKYVNGTSDVLLRTSANTWTSTTYGPQLTAVLNTNDTNQQSKVAYTYDSNGNVSSVSEYDYGISLVRTTNTTYSTAFSAQHILDRPTQVVIKDAGGNTVSRTDFAYDGSSLASQLGVTNHDDTGYPAFFPPARGNVTQVTRYSNASGGTGSIQRNFTYDMLGNLISADLDCCNRKTWVFDPATRYAFPSSITRGTSPSLTTSVTYDSYFRLHTSTDENGQSLTYAYDDLKHTDRVLTVIRSSDGATFSTSYDDTSLHPKTVTSNSVNNAVQQTYVDASGTPRVRRDSLNGSTVVSSVVSYVDSIGRTYKVSNPFGPNDTEIDTTTSFDALNRPVTITPQTGGSSQFAYSGNSTQVTDPAGKTRKNFSDALGRLVRVDEPGWADGTPSHATVTITGAEQNYGHWTVCNLQCQQHGGESVFIVDGYDTGTVTLTLNGSTSTTVTYGQSSTPTTIATALVSAINGNSSRLANAASSAGTVTLTSIDADASSNYPLTAAITYDTAHFSQPSFNLNLPNPPNMTGGQDATDHGTHTPTLSTPMSTGYAYDVLNDLTLVDQPPQTRTYVYDSLGRVTSLKTPEAVDNSVPPHQLPTTFTYDDSGSGQVLTRTDARGVVTTYGYDGLNRLATIGYSDGTPGVTYTYGTSSPSNNNGRLISASDSSVTPAWSTIYGYNNLGQVTGVTKTISGAIYNIGYSYNTVGELASITYPSGRVVNQTYDPVGRLQTIADAANNYMTIAPNTDYNAAGQLTHFVYGNGVNANFGFNDHLQVTSISYTKTGGPDFLNLTYSYTTTANPGNNGQIASITNTDPTKSETFTYDAWGRLSAAQAGSSGATWGYTYNYDRFGNRRAQNPVGTGTQVLLTIDQATNRIIDVGNSYDFNGNMTADTVHNYTYDAENRTKTVDSTAAMYSYDDSLRIKKVVGAATTVYIFSGPKVVAEYSGTSTLALGKEYVYSGSNLIATLIPNGSQTTVVYAHSDHLSTRAESDSLGSSVPVRTYGHLPFGETWYETGTASKWKFTSYERDNESALDYALARQDSSRLGRFMSPDPLGGRLTAPQSLNRYAYVENDPIANVDPSGRSLFVLCTGFQQNADDYTGNTQGINCTEVDLADDPVIGGGGGGGGGGGRECQLGQPVCGVVDQIRKILQETNCLKAVTGQSNPSAELAANIDKALSNITTTEGSNQAGPHGEHVDAQTTQGAIGALIDINNFGGFYQPKMRNSSNNGFVDLYVGSYPGGSPGAQDLTLLHEVAHQFNAIPSDKGTKGKPDYDQSTKNTATIEKACGSAIDSATGAK